MAIKAAARTKTAPLPAYHVCFGDYPKHFKQLERWSRSGRTDEWTVNSSAVAGDVALFYMQRPFAGIVATGVFASPAVKERRDTWSYWYMAQVGKIRMLPCPIQRKDLMLEMPKWGWLRYPRRSTTVPADLVPTIERLLKEFSVKVARGSALPHPRGIPASIMEAVYKRDKGHCVKCGSGTNLQFDHILPWSKGGTSLSATNIQLLCLSCNARKSDRFA